MRLLLAAAVSAVEYLAYSVDRAERRRQQVYLLPCETVAAPLNLTYHQIEFNPSHPLTTTPHWPVAGGVGFRSLNLNRGLSRAMSTSVPPGAPGSVAVPAVAIAVPASMAHIPTAAAVAVPSGGVAEVVIQGPANTAGQSEGDLEEGEFDPVAPAEGGSTLAGEAAQSTLAVSSPRAAVASRVGL